MNIIIALVAIKLTAIIAFVIARKHLRKRRMRALNRGNLIIDQLFIDARNKGTDQAFKRLYDLWDIMGSYGIKPAELGMKGYDEIAELAMKAFRRQLAFYRVMYRIQLPKEEEDPIILKSLRDRMAEMKKEIAEMRLYIRSLTGSVFYYKHLQILTCRYNRFAHISFAFG